MTEKICPTPVTLEEYDEAQLAAAHALNIAYKAGNIPGLGGLVNELSRVTSAAQAQAVIADWLNGVHVSLPEPEIRGY